MTFQLPASATWNIAAASGRASLALPDVTPGNEPVVDRNHGYDCVAAATLTAGADRPATVWLSGLTAAASPDPQPTTGVSVVPIGATPVADVMPGDQVFVDFRVGPTGNVANPVLTGKGLSSSIPGAGPKPGSRAAGLVYAPSEALTVQDAATGSSTELAAGHSAAFDDLTNIYVNAAQSPFKGVTADVVVAAAQPYAPTRSAATIATPLPLRGTGTPQTATQIQAAGTPVTPTPPADAIQSGSEPVTCDAPPRTAENLHHLATTLQNSPTLVTRLQNSHVRDLAGTGTPADEPTTEGIMATAPGGLG